MESEVRIRLSDSEETILDNVFRSALMSAKGDEYYEITKLYSKIAEAVNDAKDTSSRTFEYQKRGFKDRTAYLKSLSAEYGVTLSSVEYLADTLGSHEDFDKLVDVLEGANSSDLEDITI